MKLLSLVFALLLCLPAGALTLAEAEQSLERAVALPSRGLSWEPVPLEEVEATLRREAPGNAGARRSLGRLLLLQGRFGEAARTFAAGPEASEAKARQGIAARLEGSQPGGYRVLRVERFRKGWVVLEAKPQKVDRPFPSYSDPKVLVTSLDGSKVEWQRSLTQPDRENLNQLQLWVAPLSGEGSPDLVVECTIYGASWMPSNLYVFGGPQLSQRLEAFGAFPLWIDSLGIAGHYFVGASHNIGNTLAHVEQPMWTDIYGFEGGRFRVVNEKFPQHFRENRSQIEELLRSHPDDYDLSWYLGQIQEIEGEPQAARATYGEASRRIQARLAEQTTGADERKSLRAAEARLQSRLKALGSSR